MSLEHIKPTENIITARETHANAIKNLGAMTTLPSDEGMRALFKTMLTIRRFEERAWKSAKEGKSLPIHPYTGHEAVSTGICSLLNNTDKIIVNHRPYGHYIAKGGSLDRAMAELYGKRTGVNAGIGGELYLSDPSIGYITSDMIVAACITIATGVGLSMKLQKTDDVVVCFFGEAATTNGAYHEAMIMASLYKIPVLFVCENNGYSTNTPAIEFKTNELVSPQAAGYGFPVNTIDGTDVLVVRDAGQKALWHIRNNKTPYFLEALVPRIGAHKQQLVEARPDDRILYANMRDPILKYKSVLISNGLMSYLDAAYIESDISNEINNAVTFAERDTALTIDELRAYMGPTP